MAGKVWAIAYEAPGDEDDYEVAFEGTLYPTREAARDRLEGLGFRLANMLASRRERERDGLPYGTEVRHWTARGHERVDPLFRSVPVDLLFRAWDWGTPDPHAWALARIVELDLPDADGGGA